MIQDDLLKAAKLRVRKTRSDALDDDINQLAETAIADLTRIGVSERFFPECSDPLLREAVLTYVSANYGSNPDSEKLMAAYDMILTKIKGGKYFDV